MKRLLRCCMQHLPGGQYVKTVTVLDLEGNNFRAIPEALRGAKQLSHLDLSCNHEPADRAAGRAHPAAAAQPEHPGPQQSQRAPAP